MKELDKKVNIIPIIAKADTISRQELLQFKKKVSDGLHVYFEIVYAYVEYGGSLLHMVYL